MERCIITGQLLPDVDVTITHEGPVAVSLFEEEIQFDESGHAVMTAKVLEMARKAFGREPANS